MASKDIKYKKKIFSLSYELVNPSQKDILLILHGWGSNKEIMKQAFSGTLREYKHIYLDMPGFGKSSSGMILETIDYANIVQLFIDALGVEVKVAMGHSFGGKVSTLLAPPCLVLLSSSGILIPKLLGVRLKIATFKLLKPFGLTRLHQLFVSDDAKGMSHEMYETFKNVVNEEFEMNFTNSQSHALLFWGREDTATPLWSGEKISKLIKKSTIYPMDGDHFFFLKHSQSIAQTISNSCKEHQI